MPVRSAPRQDADVLEEGAASGAAAAQEEGANERLHGVCKHLAADLQTVRLNPR